MNELIAVFLKKQRKLRAYTICDDCSDCASDGRRKVMANHNLSCCKTIRKLVFKSATETSFSRNRKGGTGKPHK